jgi:hypothetical protein
MTPFHPVRATIILAALALTACAHQKLPICEPAIVATEEWSRPCRAADETNAETGAIELPDPTAPEAAE